MKSKKSVDNWKIPRIIESGVRKYAFKYKLDLDI